MLLQKGYKVDWGAYFSTVQDLENSWNALIYARRHSKVDLWKSIDPDWRDEGYQYVYLISREESYTVSFCAVRYIIMLYYFCIAFRC